MDRPVKLGAHDQASYQVHNTPGMIPPKDIQRVVYLHQHLNRPVSPRTDEPECGWKQDGQWNLKRFLDKTIYNDYGEAPVTRPMPWLYNYRGSGLTDEQVLASLQSAFNVWDSVAPGINGSTFLATSERPSSFAGKMSAYGLNDFNEIGFGPLQSTSQINVLIAEAVIWKNVQTGEIVEADIMFNSAIPWAHYSLLDHAEGGEGHWKWMSTNKDKMCLFAVAVTEFGHALGLGHVNHPEHSMFMHTGRAELKKATLHCGDIEGILALYSV